MDTLKPVQSYYQALSGKHGLEEVPMADGLQFRSPLMTLDSAEAFRQALGGLLQRAKSLEMRHQLVEGDVVVSVYDFDLGASKGPIPMAEVVRVKGGEIQEVDLIFDPAAMA